MFTPRERMPAMPEWDVWGVVTGTKYLGKFTADTKEEAEALALESDAAQPSLCHHCSDECEDPQCDKAIAEPAR